MYIHGWYQLAFEDELEEGVTPLTFGSTQLLALRDGEQIRIADAVCPHRGAHLGRGGKFDGECVRCPFHGYRIGVGKPGQHGLQIHEYESLVIGGMVFARLSDQATTDLPSALSAIDSDHEFIKGFDLQVKTNIEMVMENGFDRCHFRSVHGLMTVPEFTMCESPERAFQVDGEFRVPSSSWDSNGGQPVVTPYRARAFSPGVVIAELAGEPPYSYKIITTAAPGECEDTSTVRLTLALPRSTDGSPPDQYFAKALLEASRAGLELDKEIWDHLFQGQNTFTDADAEVMAFGEFCATFKA
jgi:3-ketosteroid 9alpha-monooxygenase subunit A